MKGNFEKNVLINCIGLKTTCALFLRTFNLVLSNSFCSLISFFLILCAKRQIALLMPHA